MLTLRAVAREIARVCGPAAVMLVAPERGLDHAAPSVKTSSLTHRARRGPGAALALMAHPARGLHALQHARPPRHGPPGPTRLSTRVASSRRVRHQSKRGA